LEEWLGSLEIDVEAVADVGGRKLPVKDRTKSWHVKRYDIIDLPEYDLNLKWTLENIYDAVFCLEVFEYLYDPLQGMINLYKILKTPGTLFASFHFIYSHHGPWGKDYLRYTRWGVDKLLTEAGFSHWELYCRPFKNPEIITGFYASEDMRRAKPDQIHLDQGYLVKAIK